MKITAQSPCEVQIIEAALERASAQALLEKGANEFAPTWTMRQRQRAVDQADRKIRDAANTMLAADMLTSII